MRSSGSRILVAMPLPWLVLKGTKLGAAEGFWRQWIGREYDDFEVVIEE